SSLQTSEFWTIHSSSRISARAPGVGVCSGCIRSSPPLALFERAASKLHFLSLPELRPCVVPSSTAHSLARTLRLLRRRHEATTDGKSLAHAYRAITTILRANTCAGE